MANKASDKKPAAKKAKAARPQQTGAPQAANQKRPPQGHPAKGQAPQQGKRPASPNNQRGGQPLRSRPANENEPGTAALISRMRKRPSSAPLWMAFVTSILWVFAFFALFGDRLFVLAEPLQGNNLPQVLTGALFLFLPIILSFSTAYLLWRAQQMRHVSEGLINTAMRLIRPQEVAADGLMSISQSIRYDVDQLVGGIEHAMARAGELEGMVHREISNIERAFGNNEERIRTLLSGLENQRNALREAGDVIQAQTDPLISRLEQNTSSLGGLVKTANSTLTTIDDELKLSSGDLKQTVEEFSNRAGVAGTEINQQTQRMDQMSGVLVNEMRVFSESLTSQIDALDASTTRINKESADFNENIHNMETKVVATLKTSADELSNANTDVVRNVERMTGGLSETLTSTGAQFAELLQSTSSNLSYHLKSTASEVATVMEKSGVDVSQQIETSGVALSDKLLSVSGDFVGNVAQARDDLYTYLEDASTKMTSRLEDSTTALYSEVEKTTNQISGKLEDTTGVLFNRVAEATGQMSAHLDESTTRLSGSIEETSTQMVQRLETSTSRLSGLLDVASDDMTTKLDDTTNKLAEKLDASATNLTGTLADTSQQITGQLDETIQNLSTQLDRSSNDMTVRLADTSEKVSSQLEATAGDLATNLDATTASVTQYFDKTTGDVTTQLADTSTRLLAQLDEAAGDMTIRLEDTSSKLAQQLDGVTDGMTGRLSDTTVRLTEQLSVAAEDMTSKLTDSTSEIAHRLNSTSLEMTGRLDSTTSKLTEKLDQSSYDLGERLDTTADQFHTQLNSVSGTMLGRIENTVSDLGKRFDISASLLEDVTTNITTRFDGTSAEFTKVLEDASGQILTDLGSASTAFADGLKSSTDQITGGFEETTASLADRVDKATDAIESRTNATSRRLEAAGVKFAGHIEKANSYLSDQLAGSAKHLDDELETISTSLMGRLENTSGKISTRLEDASSIVERAVDHFNNGMDRAIDVRENQMDDLVKMLANKAEDVDTMMRNYVSVIEDSLGNAHGKSDDIVRLLTAQSGAAASNLQTEIARIEATSDEQIAKAAQALGNQYQAVIGQLNGMLASTTSDFADTAQSMRSTAQQVAKDIDFARTELRRTILDLPDETRNNADAMRQVVSDQITALNALADVVKRQTGMLDLSGPGVQLAPDEVTPGKLEGVRAGISQARDAAPAPRQTAAPQATRPAPAPAAKPAPAQAVQPATVRGRPIGDPIKSSAKRGSANLLPHLEKQQPAVAKASAKAVADKPRSKQARNARETENLVAKLNLAARDLTEAFEDDLPTDLERKFSAGQTHVYTHRLYKARGQKMYNMVSHGYKNERLIRGRVDAYVRLFERLLDTVQETSQGAEMVDACLGSESGKLYLLFAQAAGRLS